MNDDIGHYYCDICKKWHDNPMECEFARNKIRLSKLGPRNPNWTGGRITVNCGVCGKEIKRKLSNLRKVNYCSSKCLGVANSTRMKENNPMKDREVAKRMGETLKGNIESGKFIPWASTEDGRKELSRVAKIRMSENNPMFNEESKNKRFITVQSNYPIEFMGVRFRSKVEANFCKWLVEIGRMSNPINGENCNALIGGKEFDFCIKDAFIEIHPWDRNGRSYEEYYDMRRSILDKFGYKDSKLLVVSEYHIHRGWNEDDVFKN